MLLSVNIHQHLLENEHLILQQFYEQSRILDLAQHNEESLIPQDSVTTMTEEPPFISASSQPRELPETLVSIICTCFFLWRENAVSFVAQQKIITVFHMEKGVTGLKCVKTKNEVSQFLEHGFI